MAVNLDTLLIDLVIKIIILAPSLWLSGRAIVGKEKAKFFDAVWIIVLGALVGGIFSYLDFRLHCLDPSVTDLAWFGEAFL